MNTANINTMRVIIDNADNAEQQSKNATLLELGGYLLEKDSTKQLQKAVRTAIEKHLEALQTCPVLLTSVALGKNVKRVIATPEEILKYTQESISRATLLGVLTGASASGIMLQALPQYFSIIHRDIRASIERMKYSDNASDDTQTKQDHLTHLDKLDKLFKLPGAQECFGFETNIMNFKATLEDLLKSYTEDENMTKDLQQYLDNLKSLKDKA